MFRVDRVKQAEALLTSSYKALTDVITIDEIAKQAEIEVAALPNKQPNNVSGSRPSVVVAEKAADCGCS